ncbi:hypothetical protein C8F01DRAFT_1245353 [Mycena amicta]|nr:hypothetical protein C8F01DRAFT_1245353 [Mycena amicta]
MFSLRHFTGSSQPNVRSPSKSESGSGKGKGKGKPQIQKSRSRTESLAVAQAEKISMRQSSASALPMPVLGHRILENWQLAYAAPTPSVKPQYTPPSPPRSPAHTRSRSGSGFYIHVNEHLPEGMAPLPPPPRKVGFVYWNPEVARR